MKTTIGFNNLIHFWKWLFFIAICFGFHSGQAQNCFIQLGDATGINLADYEEELENAACALIDAFPTEFQDSFKVFDFGFYSYQSLYENELPELFISQVNTIAQTSKYYLIFGRQLSADGGFESIFLDLKLPSGDFFECTSVPQFEVIKTKLQILLQTKTVNSMESVVNQLRGDIVKMDSCCIPSIRSSCSSCLGQSDIKILLSKKGFEEFPTSIYESSNGGEFSESLRSTVVGENGWVIDIDGNEVNIYDEMISYSQLLSGMNLSFKGFITSDLNTCNSDFLTIDSLYHNSTAQNKLWWHISEGIGSNNHLYEINNFDGLREQISSNIFSDFGEMGSQDYGECKGTDRFQMPKAHFTEGDFDSPFITAEEGRAAHWVIQMFYQGFYLAQNIELEYQIPKSSANGNAGYADIVNLSTKEIFEIKTVKKSSRIKGEEEVKRYVYNANLYCKPVPSTHKFSRGKSFPFYKKELIWPDPKKKLIVWQDLSLTPEGGVLTYDLVQSTNSNKDPAPAIIPVPDKTWDDVKELIKQMALNMNNALSVATTYIQEHPEQVFLIASAVVVIIFASKAGLAASFGVLSPVLVPTIICGGVLLKVCYDFNPATQGP